MTPHLRARRSACAAALLATISAALSVALSVAILCAPASAGDAASRQGSWRDCLSRTYASNAALTGRDLAADAAFRSCRGAEDAYLAALSASPLLDEDDLARARPALAGRIRAWLVGSR